MDQALEPIPYIANPNHLEALEIVSRLRSEGFGDILDALSNPDNFTIGQRRSVGRVKKTKVQDQLGLKPTLYKSRMKALQNATRIACGEAPEPEPIPIVIEKPKKLPPPPCRLWSKKQAAKACGVTYSNFQWHVFNFRFPAPTFVHTGKRKYYTDEDVEKIKKYFRSSPPRKKQPQAEPILTLS